VIPLYTFSFQRAYITRRGTFQLGRPTTKIRRQRQYWSSANLRSPVTRWLEQLQLLQAVLAVLAAQALPRLEL
jgi:hypothetical protein